MYLNNFTVCFVIPLTSWAHSPALETFAQVSSTSNALPTTLHG